jgi:hypothetical protein
VARVTGFTGKTNYRTFKILSRKNLGSSGGSVFKNGGHEGEMKGHGARSPCENEPVLGRIYQSSLRYAPARRIMGFFSDLRRDSSQAEGPYIHMIL